MMAKIKACLYFQLIIFFSIFQIFFAIKQYPYTNYHFEEGFLQDFLDLDQMILTEFLVQESLKKLEKKVHLHFFIRFDLLIINFLNLLRA